jgi:hypothetical protein
LEEHACNTGEQCASASAIGEECCQRPLGLLRLVSVWVCRRNVVKHQKLVVDQEEISGSL